MIALTIAGGLCLLLSIGIRGARIAYEAQRADAAERELRTYNLMTAMDRVRATEPPSRQIDPDDTLPDVARRAGWIDGDKA